MSEGGRGRGGQLTSEGGDLLRSRMPGEVIYSGEDCTGVQVTPEQIARGASYSGVHFTS